MRKARFFGWCVNITLHTADEQRGQRFLTKGNLTNLYNVAEERPHRDLDRAVVSMYRWPEDISEDEALERLLALNRTSGGQDTLTPIARRSKSRSKAAEDAQKVFNILKSWIDDGEPPATPKPLLQTSS